MTLHDIVHDTACLYSVPELSLHVIAAITGFRHGGNVLCCAVVPQQNAALLCNCRSMQRVQFAVLRRQKGIKPAAFCLFCLSKTSIACC